MQMQLAAGALLRGLVSVADRPNPFNPYQRYDHDTSPFGYRESFGTSSP
jgi:hypothetical protein